MSVYKENWYRCSVQQAINDTIDIKRIEEAMRYICIHHDISTIICNRRRELKAAVNIKESIAIRIFYINHLSKEVEIDSEILSKIDGIIDVFPNKSCDSRIFIPPFVDEEKFLTFSPTKSKEEFFYNEFGIQISDAPIICMIGNFYANPKYKNHPLLLRVIADLIYRKDKSVQLMLAGGGDKAKILECQELARNLKIEEYIHFLGPVANTPELLYFCDFHVLASREEAFGIVLLEAALMKKPSIIASKTGAADLLIKHMQTGMIFVNNNADSLTDCIIYLLDNPEKTKMLGKNAHQFVISEFANEKKLKKLLSFINEDKIY